MSVIEDSLGVWFWSSVWLLWHMQTKNSNQADFAISFWNVYQKLRFRTPFEYFVAKNLVCGGIFWSLFCVQGVFIEPYRDHS